MHIGDRTYSVMTDAQTYHIELILGQTLSSGRIQDMTHDMMRKSRCYLICTSRKALDLFFCKAVELWFIGTRQMRKYRTDFDLLLIFEAGNELLHVLKFKAQAMHAAIYFYMNRIIRNS